MALGAGLTVWLPPAEIGRCFWGFLGATLVVGPPLAKWFDVWLAGHSNVPAVEYLTAGLLVLSWVAALYVAYTEPEPHVWNVFFKSVGVVLIFSTGAFAGGQACPESGGSTASSADEAEGSCYYEMTWYRMIKLGTAPFFNTELAKRAKVAYSFDRDMFSDGAVWDNANTLYQSGELVPAVIGDDGEYWVPARFDSRDLTEATTTLQGPGRRIVYLGHSEELDGGIVGDAVVAWDPIPWHAAPRGERPDTRP